ncbi:MAG: ribosomal protein S18-alanine N-acetyltransferase [Acidobacteriota bacterium]|nr:ribosomal protein S18-alanine N-acetyltransferase [Acidobacteriota bacterium]
MKPLPSTSESGLPRVRLASSDDISPMMDIARQTRTAAEWTETQYRAVFNSNSPRRLAWLVMDAKVVGFLVVRVLDREWEIENIAVSTKLQRGGYGRQLISEMIHTARTENAKLIFLEVRESNLKARAFYEKHGFRESGRRKGYYNDPVEEAILYQLVV